MPTVSTGMERILAERWLQQNDQVTQTGWASLRTTLILYGIIFVILYGSFCILRQRFPHVYNVRNNVARLHCKFSETTYGYVSWVWNVRRASDDEIFEQCGMDAVALVRLFRLGFRMSMAGIFCSTFLIPIYATADPGIIIDPETGEVIDVDNWIITTSSNLPLGSNRYVATAMAAWVLFLYCMWVLWQECHWFADMRDRFLSQKFPRNYALHVSGIPSKYRSDAALASYFKRIFSDETVTGASVVVDIPKLNAKVKERQQTLLKLEHAIALRDVKGIEVPMHRVISAEKLVSRSDSFVEIVPALEYFQDKLKTLNDEIRVLRAEIKTKQRQADEAFLASQIAKNNTGKVDSDTLDEQEPLAEGGTESESPMESESSSEHVDHTNGSDMSKNQSGSESLAPDIDEDNKSTDISAPDALSKEVVERNGKSSVAKLHSSSESMAVSAQGKSTPETKTSVLAPDQSSSKLPEDDSTPTGFKRLSSSVDEILSSVDSALAKTSSLVGRTNTSEGDPLSSAFVTFNRLSAVSAARQVVHTADPSGMSVIEPPAEDGVIWGNAAIPPSVRHTRQLISFAITGAVCVFWTIPVTFLVTLTQPEWLKDNFPRIKDLLEEAPWLEGFLNQLGPLLIQLMNNVVLPDLMKLISMIEGVVGGSRLLTSMMTKMAIFLIIQTFFVASISGSLLSAFKEIETIGDLFRFMAATLPPHSGFFIQLILIDAVLVLGIELIRTTAIIKAWLRYCIGPRLTEKERGMPYLIFRPFSCPRIFLYAHIYSREALHYMVLFTFVVLSPVTSYVLAFAYWLMEIGNRHQFFYIYDSKPDSGGRIWMELIVVILCCMLVAQVILLAHFGLRESVIAFWIIFPLVFLTGFFVIFLRVRYFPVFLNVPSDLCAEVDDQNGPETDEFFASVKAMYIQPALDDSDEDQFDVCLEETPNEEDSGEP